MIKQGDWVTNGERAGVVVGALVHWLGGGSSPVTDALTVMTQGEAQRAIAMANEPTPNEGGEGA